MPPLEARRSERIDYRAPVELLAHAEGVSVPCSVLARTLDLGAGGMRLCAPVQIPVGAQVTCRVVLGGQPAALPGRVAWLRERGSTRHGDGHGMGICFDSLDGHESGLLQHVVEQSSGYREVELHFAVLDQPVRARARGKTGGLRLSAALPILARGTELSFRFADEGPLFGGRVGDAALKEERGVRRLEVEIDVVECESVRFRRHVRYGDALEIDAKASVVATAPAAPIAAKLGDSETEPKPPVSRAPRSSYLSMIAAAALGAGLTWVTAHWPAPRPERSEFIAHPRAPQAPRTAQPAESSVRTMPAALPYGAAQPRHAVPSTSTLTRHPHAAERISAAPAKTPLPAASEPEPPTEHDSALAQASIGPAPELPPAQVQAEPKAALESAAAQPITVVQDNVTSIRIPFDGSLEGMRIRVWAAPHALAIDLPHGRSALALGRYPINDGGVTDLQLNARGSALLVRVKVSAPIASYALAAADGVLDVRLVPGTAAAQARSAR
jgi:hypothetical protein